MAATAFAAEHAYAFTDADFRFLREFVAAKCGIALGEHKRQLVYGRLARRLRALGLGSFAQYCELLRREPERELDALVSAISTNVTAFFREAHHFDFLAGELLPKLLTARGGRVRLWSAGCATGEEPYTLAVVLAEALEKHGPADARILATDISPQALEIARRGVYRLDRLGNLDAARRRRWFLRGTGAHEGQAMVHPRLRELVTFQPLNLLEAWPMRGRFDAIFCRNVVIYFDKPTKERLFARFVDQLAADGYLFLGHSESMYGMSEQFRLVGRTIYRRVAA